MLNDFENEVAESIFLFTGGGADGVEGLLIGKFNMSTESVGEEAFCN